MGDVDDDAKVRRVSEMSVVSPDRLTRYANFGIALSCRKVRCSTTHMTSASNIRPSAGCRIQVDREWYEKRKSRSS